MFHYFSQWIFLNNMQQNNNIEYRCYKVPYNYYVLFFFHFCIDTERLKQETQKFKFILL